MGREFTASTPYAARGGRGAAAHAACTRAGRWRAPGHSGIVRRSANAVRRAHLIPYSSSRRRTTVHELGLGGRARAMGHAPSSASATTLRSRFFVCRPSWRQYRRRGRGSHGKFGVRRTSHPDVRQHTIASLHEARDQTPTQAKDTTQRQSDLLHGVVLVRTAADTGPCAAWRAPVVRRPAAHRACAFYG